MGNYKYGEDQGEFTSAPLIKYTHIQSLSDRQGKVCQHRNDRPFDLWMIIHDNGNHAEEGNVSLNSAHQVSLLQPLLSSIVQSTVMHLIIVSFCQKANRTIRATKNWVI